MNLNSIAASQNTTIFLARPNDKYSDLPRHPENVDSAEECVVCSRDRGDDDSPLACDKVSETLFLVGYNHFSFLSKVFPSPFSFFLSNVFFVPVLFLIYLPI